jgi:type I restriction enzyme, S subunit
MIADLKPYPEYKESGAAWIGQIPSHWATMPNRALFEEVKDRDHPDEEMLSVTITRGIIRQKALLSGTSKKDSSNLNKSAYKLVQPGDLAYNKMRAWQGAVGASHFRGIISPAYVVMRPREGCNPAFYHHLYRTPSFQKEAERWSYGITSDMWSLRPEHFKVIYSVLPPPTEQAAIVRFLDWANGRLERAIRAKRKVIALLHEQKQAIIHKAVTQGLDPNVPKRDSGIPWLGEIPAHWEALAFARLARVVRGSSPRPAGDRRFFYGDFIPWVTVGEVTNDPSMYLESTETFLTKMGADRSTIFPADTVILTNSGATLGVPKILKVKACANDGIVAFLGLSGSIQKSFAYIYLSTLTKRLRDEMKQGGTQPNLNTGIIRRIVCPVPPLGEQGAILSHVNRESAPIISAIDRYEREITLLLEYRTRLVSDVVTGKLDVREAAQSIPEEDVFLASDGVEDEAAEPEMEEVE